MKFTAAFGAALVFTTGAQAEGMLAFARGGDGASATSVWNSLTSAGAIPSGDYDAAAWSSAMDSLKSEGKFPSITPGPVPTGAWGPGKGPWGPGAPGWNHQWQSKGPGGQPWGGPDGCGPWGDGNWGPFSDWSTKDDWRTKPWTGWWGGTQCPGSDWPGWTEGPWSTKAPWTSWEGCTAKTTGTEIVTQTPSGTAQGTPAVSTAYDIQVSEVKKKNADNDNSDNDDSKSQGAAGPMRTAAPVLAAGAALVGFVAAL